MSCHCAPATPGRIHHCSSQDCDMQEEAAPRPWLSRVVFCVGFTVGFCLCFFAICHLRGIPSAQWLHCLATLCNAPTAYSDPAPAMTGPSDSPPVPSRQLLCWVGANQKLSCSRSFPCCSGILLLVGSTPVPNLPGVFSGFQKQEKLQRKNMAASRTFHRRHNRVLGAADNACVVVEKPRWTLSQFRKHPTLILDWADRTCGGRGYTLRRHATLRLVGALQSHSPFEFIQVACCPITGGVASGDTGGQAGPISFQTL